MLDMLDELREVIETDAPIKQRLLGIVEVFRRWQAVFPPPS